MGLSLGALDLSRAFQHCVLRTNRAAESHDCLSHALSDHVLDWHSDSVETTLYRARTPRLQAFVLRYGAEVEVRPRPFDGFAVVQMPIRGACAIEFDGHRMPLQPGQAAIIAPGRDVRLRWSQDCEQLILKVPLRLMSEAACMARFSVSAEPGADAAVRTATLIDEAAQDHWGGLMQGLAGLLMPDAGQAPEAAPPLSCHASWIGHFEQNVALFLLTQQHGTEGGSGDVAALQAAERYMRQRLSAPLALADLAHAAGVSERKLHMLCKRQHGVSPMTWLRNLRLDAAHELLRFNARLNVTEAALTVGFGHFGRFSAYYRDRFGTLPGQTARRLQ